MGEVLVADLNKWARWSELMPAKHSHGSDGPGFHVGLVQMENQTIDGKVGVCWMEIVIPGTFDQNQKPEKITVDQSEKYRFFNCSSEIISSKRFFSVLDRPIMPVQI